MAVRYSTSTVHPRDSISYWLEVATKAFVRHEFRSLDGSSYRGSIHAGCLDSLGVSTFECDACGVDRSARDIARADSDDILLCLQLSGIGHFHQDGREGANENGSFLLIDTRRPFSIFFPERVRSITFKIARADLEARLGDVAGLTARAITPVGSVAGLASGFLSMLSERLDAIDGAAASKLVDQALDLVTLAAADELGQTGTGVSSQRSTALLRLKSVIEAHLRERDLKPAAIAAAAGISVRYANALLSREGSSVERYVLHRRLERCREALEDATQAYRMIGEIAFSWGFSDLSHFARRFRAAYGLTPGDYRRRAFLQAQEFV
jgi:AraC family transcriptional activator of tynA and feaB